MSLYVIAITLTVAANVGYHLFQRSIRSDVNPAASLIGTYVTALVLSAVLLPFLARGEMVVALKKVGWPSIALGAAIVLLELGFLLAYRAGWHIGTAALYSNATVALLLLPIGMLVFAEPMSTRRAIGLAATFVGLILLSQRPENGAQTRSKSHSSSELQTQNPVSGSQDP